MCRSIAVSFALASAFIMIGCSELKNKRNNAFYDIEINLEDFITADKVVADNSKNNPSVLDIAAFNIRIFGRAKMSKPFVVDQLVKIILRYDVILIQEIRDASETAIHNLLAKVNTASKAFRYNMVMSSRLGRSSSKEQYAYIYNSDMLTVLDQYVYDDSSRDIFQREPFVVKFASSKLGMKFAVIGIHTAPSDAVTEIDHLVDVYEDAKRRFSVSNVILMGDFNAGCTYVADWSSIRLATDHRFYWLINDITDTTSGPTECAYDRIVVAGDQLLKAIDPLSPGVFHYDTEYGLTQQQALSVSDHYPVSMKFKTREDVQHVDLTRQFVVQDASYNADATNSTLSRILSSISLKQTYQVEKYFNKLGKLLVFEAKFQPASLATSLTNLDAVKKDFSPLISGAQISAAKRHLNELSMIEFLPKNNGFYQTLKDYYKKRGTTYVIMAKCKVIPTPKCSIEALANNGV